MYNVREQNEKMTNDELYDMFNTEQKVIDKYVDVESKWSGKINIIDESISPGKEWDCSINISNKTLPQEVRHELLHARSISIYGQEFFDKFQWTEEATVEFFNKQISDLEKEQYYPNMYYGMVETLEEIADMLKLNRFEFSKQLFVTHVKDRYSYITNINNSTEIQELLEVAFYGEKN